MRSICPFHRSTQLLNKATTAATGATTRAHLPVKNNVRSIRSIIAEQAKLYRRAERAEDAANVASSSNSHLQSRQERLIEQLRGQSTVAIAQALQATSEQMVNRQSEPAEDGEVLDLKAETEQEPSLEDEPLEGLTSQAEIGIGDLVEYWPAHGQRCTAIVLKLPTIEAGQANTRHMTIDSRGSINFTESRRYLMVVPGFASPEQLSWIDPADPVLQGDPRLNQIVKEAYEFVLESDALRTEFADRLANLYGLLPVIVRKQAMPVSCAEAARVAFETENVTPVHIHAVHASMMRDRVHFLPDTIRSIAVPIFRSRDPGQVWTIRTITTSVRYRAPSYRAFIERAKKVAAWGEEATKAEGPLTVVQAPAAYTWEEIDRRFIQFLLQAILERPDSADVEIYTTPAATIVKDIGLFPGETATRDLVHKTLKKLGVLAPWDISMNRSPTLALPDHGSSRTADKHQSYLEGSFTKEALENKPLADFGLSDRLIKHRHDFGDLPVYTIDSESAHELDDGISIDEHGWMHVHIANPAAFIKPDSPLGKIAQHRTATRYLDYAAYPMLPPALTQKYFSLAERANGTPCITTSFKLQETGEVGEILVRPSIIRNVIRTSYRAVDQALGSQSSVFDEMNVLSSHWQDNDASEQPDQDSGVPQAELTDEDVSRLKAMHDFLQPSQRYRLAQGAFEWADNGEQMSSLATQPAILPGMQPSTEVPTFYSGKPGIRYTFARRDLDFPVGVSKATRIVTEAAILANHATALFCQRNAIPIMYRSAEFVMKPDERASLLSRRGENGVLKLVDILGFQHLFRPTQVSLTPKRMDYVGLPVYMTVTSPLRRFPDLCGQWALQKFFKQKEANYNSTALDLDLEAMLPELERTMLAIKRRTVLSGQNVILQLLDQKWRDGELSGRFDAYVITPPKTSAIITYNASVPAWGNRKVLVSRSPSEALPKAGDKIQVEVEGFDHFDFNIHCKCVSKEQ